jgi:hypothetical protein
MEDDMADIFTKGLVKLKSTEFVAKLGLVTMQEFK